MGLSEVAGNHSRFLFDFSPESVVFRISDDPAPRILYPFEETTHGVTTPTLLNKVATGDIPTGEIFVGGAIAEWKEIEKLGLQVCTPGVRRTLDAVKAELKARLKLE